MLVIDELSIPRAQLTFVVGQIGAGKTALLHAIMNEMDNHFGCEEAEPRPEPDLSGQIQSENESRVLTTVQRTILVRGTLAYVSQNHWLQSSSVRENILFGRDYDRDWYQECLRACQLEHDLANFPNGDQKLVG